jgi:hypothetical protein
VTWVHDIARLIGGPAAAVAPAMATGGQRHDHFGRFAPAHAENGSVPGLVHQGLQSVHAKPDRSLTRRIAAEGKSDMVA